MRRSIYCNQLNISNNQHSHSREILLLLISEASPYFKARRAADVARRSPTEQAKPMANLQTLPVELILSIESYLLSASRQNLLLTSQRLNKILTPSHYQKVHFANPDKTSELSSYGIANPLQILPSYTSRIHNLRKFTQTISASADLLALINKLDLRWQKQDEDNIQSILDRLHPTKSHPLPNLKAIHLSPPSRLCQIPDRLPITSLAYHHTTTNSKIQGLQHLHELITIPTLTSFTLSAWHYIDDPDAPSIPMAPAEAGSSNVQHLSLTDIRVPATDLHRVLAWPCGLRTLTLDIRPDGHGSDDNGEAVPMQEISYALAPYRGSLEGLEIRGGSKATSKYLPAFLPSPTAKPHHA